MQFAERRGSGYSSLWVAPLRVGRMIPGPGHPMLWTVRAEYAVIGIVLAGLGAAGGLYDRGHQACDLQPRVAGDNFLEIRARDVCLAVRQFPHDVGQPRAPRHRSDRPHSFSINDRHLHGDRFQGILCDTPEVIWRIESLDLAAIAGHPTQLLRPPAALL